MTESILGEGDAPLVGSSAIGLELGVRLQFKCEHLNPTGSYKDRFTARELMLLREEGTSIVLAASSGNGAASLAAYAARMGTRCCIFVCDNTPSGKLAQIAAYGAIVVRVAGYCTQPEHTVEIDDELDRLAATRGTRLVVAAYCSSPEGMRGVETIGHELAAEGPVDHVFVPLGGGGLYTAIGRGLRDASGDPPRAHIVQPKLNDTVVTPLREGTSARAVSTVTQISGLANQRVYDGDTALGVARELGGSGFLVEDEDAWRWQGELRRREGIWVEPAGAVSVAGLQAAVAEGVVRSGERVLCILTGHGFKTAAPNATADLDLPRLALDDLEAFVSAL